MDRFFELKHASILKIIDSSSAILNSQGFGYVIIDSENHQIVYANSKLFSMSGFTLEKIVGKECHNLLCPAQKGACPISDLDQNVDNFECMMICASGEKIPIIKTVLPLYLQGTKYFMESLVDITIQQDMQEMLSRKNEALKTEIDRCLETQKKLENLAYYDYLTGLPNRLFFIERLKHAIFLAKHSATLIAVVFLDLDGFKMINDTSGHLIGDELLVDVARRLSHVVRSQDTVARIGGDEFVIMSANIKNSDEIKNIMDKTIAAFKQPITIRKQEIFVTTSLGVAIYPRNGTNAEELIQNADTAMYKAKEGGRNQGIFYSPDR